MKGLSLFSGAGIGETYLEQCGIDVVVANEIVEKRANLYKVINPRCNVICGDITEKETFENIINYAKGVEFILASPPCQGMSVAGKNRHQDTMVVDDRNYLVNYVFKAIEILHPKYILIENVPALLKILLPHNGKMKSIINILNEKFGDEYQIDGQVVDAADYGVPQTRLRAIVKIWPKDEKWEWPTPVKHKITVREAIGHLPSIEAGEASNIKWHFARKHDERHILWINIHQQELLHFQIPFTILKRKMVVVLKVMSLHIEELNGMSQHQQLQ